MADYIIIVEHGRGEQGPTGATGGVTSEVLEAKEAAEAARDEAEKWATEAQKNTEDIKTELKEYIDSRNVLNAKPKIGYGEDDCYANIYGDFVFSSRVNTTVYPIHDNMDRETVLFSGNNGVDSVAQVYAAYRMADDQDFSFLPSALRPSHLTTDEVMWTVIGLGNEWIIYIVYDTVADTYQTWLAMTSGSINPADWYDSVNITSIVAPENWTNLAPIYVPSNDVIVVVRQDFPSIYVAVYKTDLTLVKDYTQLVSLGDIIDRSDYDLSQGTLTRRGRLAAFHDATNAQLNIFSPAYISNLQVTGGNVHGGERFVYTPFSLSNDFLGTDGGTAALLLEALTDYNWMYLGKGVFNTTGGAGSKDCSVVSDDFGNVTYFCHAWQAQSLYFRRFDGAKVTEDANTWWSNPQINMNFLLPDVCPWAKEIRLQHYFMDGVLYGRGGNSKKYGTAYYATELDDTLQDDYLKFKIGTWWIPQEQEGSTYAYPSSINTSFHRISESVVKWYYSPGVGSLIYEITVDDSFEGADGRTYAGRRNVASTGRRIPSIPGGYTYKFAIPDIANNLIYYVVTETTSLDTTRQGYLLFLVYDILMESFTVIRDIPAELEALCKRSYDASGVNAAQMAVYTSALVDLDGCVFLGIAGQIQSNQFSNGTYKIDMSTTPIVTYQSFDQGGVNTQLGYDSRFGYFGQVFDTAAYSRGIIRTSKNPFTGEEKTREQFFDQDDYYTFYIGRDTGIGLVAYHLQTPIFVGGSFSIMPEEEIYLSPNADNYIYFGRDSTNRETYIEVQTRKVGSEKAFSRVLVSKITTNSETITAQENYAVKWDY